MKNNWNDIKGFEGAYMVSNDGFVKSLDRDIFIKDHKIHVKGRVLKPIPCVGYHGVVLANNGIKKHSYIHRLVAEAFIPNPENKPCVNHKDGDRLNNHVNNLEWCTHKENTSHSIKNKFHNPVGEGNSNSKLSRKNVQKIREMYDTGNYFQREIADVFNVSQPAVNAIVNRNRWGHI